MDIIISLQRYVISWFMVRICCRELNNDSVDYL